MSKKIRHQKILDLVTAQTVTSQEHLRELLEESGFTVTQSTLSRDLKDLALVKGREGYQLPADPVEPESPDRALRVAVGMFLLGCTPAGNLVVLKTAAGNAQALAIALDRAAVSGVVGSVAGDDTVLVVATTPEGARRVAADLLAMA